MEGAHVTEFQINKGFFFFFNNKCVPNICKEYMYTKTSFVVHLNLNLTGYPVSCQMW